MFIQGTDRELREKIKSYSVEFNAISHRSSIATLKAYLLPWIFICGLTIIQFYINPGYLYSIFFSAIIAIQMHSLLVMMHSASHWQLCKDKRINDYIGEIFSAWPFLVSMESYRTHHAAHHQQTNTDQDPDWNRRIGKESWTFPLSTRKFQKIFFLYFLGMGIIEMIFIQMILNKGGVVKAKRQARILVTTLLGISLYVLGIKTVLFCYFLPLYYILPAIMRVRSIAEHWGLSYRNEFEGSRNINANFIERIIFGPNQNNLHLVHHLLPSIPWFQSQEAHKILLRIPEYKNANSNTNGYFVPFQKKDNKTLYEQITI